MTAAQPRPELGQQTGRLMAPQPLSLDDILKPKLPVFATVGESIRLTFANLGSLFAVSWIWLLLVMLPVAMLPTWLMLQGMEQAQPDATAGQSPLPFPVDSLLFMTVVSVLAQLVVIVPLASIAVNWHRLILRGEPATTAKALRLDRPVWRYIGIAFLLFLMMVIPYAVQMALADQWLQLGTQRWELAAAVLVAAILVTLVLAVVGLRLSMILPGVAVENGDAQLSTAWQATRGHTLRLIAITLLISLVAMLASMVISFVSALIMLATGALDLEAASVTMPPLHQLIGMQVVMTLVNLVVGAVFLTFLSIGYRYFFERERVT
jgi:hypothetical protein